MEDELIGMIACHRPGTMLWSRITRREGWEKGIMRAVEIHERLASPVEISRFEEGIFVPMMMLTTRDGFMHVHVACQQEAECLEEIVMEAGRGV